MNITSAVQIWKNFFSDVSNDSQVFNKMYTKTIHLHTQKIELP